jgi:hypothetical protein
VVGAPERGKSRLITAGVKRKYREHMVVGECLVRQSFRGHTLAGLTATWLRSVSIGVSLTMIQSVREKELHLLQ